MKARNCCRLSTACTRLLLLSPKPPYLCPGTSGRALWPQPHPQKLMLVNLGTKDNLAGPGTPLRLEIENDEQSARIACSGSGAAVWRDQVKAPVLRATGNLNFSAVALTDGSLLVSVLINTTQLSWAGKGKLRFLRLTIRSFYSIMRDSAKGRELFQAPLNHNCTYCSTPLLACILESFKLIFACPWQKLGKTVSIQKIMNLPSLDRYIQLLDEGHCQQWRWACLVTISTLAKNGSYWQFSWTAWCICGTFKSSGWSSRCTSQAFPMQTVGTWEGLTISVAS